MKHALTDSSLKLKLETSMFKHFSGLDFTEYVQPASFDIPVGTVAYEMKSNVIPHGRKISDIVNEHARRKVNLGKGATLVRGRTYFFPIGLVDIPKEFSVLFSPKSTTGRNDLHVRSMVDYRGGMDVINPNTRSQWWLSAIPNSWGGVRIKSYQSLSQAMVFLEGRQETDLLEHVVVSDHLGNEIPKKTLDGEIMMHLSVPKDEVAAYKAKKTRAVLDMTKLRANSLEDFFEPVYANEDGSFDFKKGEFYLMGTKGRIAVGEDVSVEMHPGKHNFGELRIHYAGFFDPGFGIDYRLMNKDLFSPQENILRNYGVGATGVLEIRPHENLKVYDNTEICTLKVYPNVERPTSPYGKDGKSNYANQRGIKPSKHIFIPGEK